MALWRRETVYRQGAIWRPPSIQTSMSNDLAEWIYRGDLYANPKLAPRSIWMESLKIDHSGAKQRTGEIVGMSDFFRSTLRPIFKSVYDDLFKGGLARENLGQSVRISGNKLVIVGKASKSGYMRETIDSLKDIVEAFVDSQRQETSPGVLSPLPDVVTRFYRLCQSASSEANPTRMREKLYLILKNPIMFDDQDEILFMEKAFSLWKMDQFEILIPMAQLDGYLNHIDQSTALYSVMVFKFGTNKHVPARAPRAIPTPRCYYQCYTSILYYANCQKHFQEYHDHNLMSIRDVHDIFMSNLPSVVPIVFSDFADWFCSPAASSFFRQTRWASYSSFLEEAPRFVYLEINP